MMLFPQSIRICIYTVWMCFMVKLSLSDDASDLIFIAGRESYMIIGESIKM